MLSTVFQNCLGDVDNSFQRTQFISCIYLRNLLTHTVNNLLRKPICDIVFCVMAFLFRCFDFLLSCFEFLVSVFCVRCCSFLTAQLTR